MPYKAPTRLRRSAYIAQVGRCCYCFNPMWLENVNAFAEANHFTLKQAKLLKCTAEHLNARSTGGNNSSVNIAAACLYCNLKRHQRKHELAPEQFRKHVSRRLAKGGWHGLPHSS